MEDSKIIELFFARNEDAIKQTDDTYGRRLYSVPFGFPSQQGALVPIGNPEPKELPSLWNPSPF